MINWVETLSDHPEAFAAVLHGFVEGLQEGWFPASRRTPNGNESCVWVELSTGIVGFITFYQPDHRPMVWVDLVWVDPPLRQRGYGAVMLDTIIEQCRAKKIENIELGTLLHNDAMQALAEGRNFKAQSVSYRLSLTEAT